MRNWFQRCLMRGAWGALNVAGLVCGLLLGTPAWAQAKCVPAATLQRNAAQSYLIRLTELGGAVPIDGDGYAGARFDARGARFEVLKVYSGDVAALSELAHAMLVIHCSADWGLGCRILEEDNYPFYEGQMFVVYDKPNADGVLQIRLGPCPGSRRFINNTSDLESFERKYPPVWESETWLRELPLADVPVDSAGADDEDAKQVDSVQDEGSAQ